MNILENLKIALASIRSNKMRSFLTMLGIIIGISSVIMIISLGNGGKERIMGEFEKIGAATVQIKVDTKNAVDADYITVDDVSAISRKLPYVKYATPVIQRSGSVAALQKDKDAVAVCVNNSFADLYGLEFLHGRFFSAQECDANANVAVIDETTAKTLFGSTDAVGYRMDVALKTNRFKVKVIGVVKNNSMSMFSGKNAPAIIYMPVNTLLAASDDISNKISGIYVMATSKNLTDTAGNASVSMIEARHGNRGRELYSFQNMITQVDQINNIMGIFTAFISAVAAISLLVGGIGVMNIMLVAVTERTREIGIRKSLGAKTGIIMTQFLTESVIITLIGGLLGILFGLLGAVGIGHAIGVTPLLSPLTFAVAILFSCSVGIFFGIYPARKAARMNPIEALRHD